jgi:hypothetical protein
MIEQRPAHFVGIPIGPWYVTRHIVHTLLKLIDLRGHFRPLLHTSLNLLVLHPNLHLTLLLAPSAHPRVTSELALPTLRHLKHAQRPDRPVVERLQVIEVVDPESPFYDRFTADSTAIEGQADLMAEEGKMFNNMLPGYLLHLFQDERGDTKFAHGGENKFAGLPPSFIIYDVRR